VYRALWKLRQRIELIENKKDREDLKGIVSDLNQGIYGWEQDIKRSLVPFHIRNTYLAGDPITWLDDDLKDDNDEDEKDK
jgi:hypothetical protein